MLFGFQSPQLVNMEMFGKHLLDCSMRNLECEAFV